MKIDDGGILGQAFYDHCQRLGKPVLAGPIQLDPSMPAGLREREVRDPTPVWCWSLVTRADDDRAAVAALRADATKLARAAGLHVQPAGPAWLPPDDPHRAEVAALPT